MRTNSTRLDHRPAGLVLAALSLACLVPALALAQQQRAPIQPNELGQAQQEQPSRQVQQPAQSEQLAAYFVDKLLLANHSEKELSKIATERSQNPEIKQFAQTLIDDHTQFDEQLAQIAPQAVARFAEHDRARATGEPAQVRTSARERADHDLLTQLCAINHRAAANNLAMSKQMLETYQGKDFDMAFLGMQIGGHAWLLSELKALDGVGSSEFQQLVASTSKQVKEHLKQAEEIKRKYEDERAETARDASNRGDT